MYIAGGSSFFLSWTASSNNSASADMPNAGIVPPISSSPANMHGTSDIFCGEPILTGFSTIWCLDDRSARSRLPRLNAFGLAVVLRQLAAYFSYIGPRLYARAAPPTSGVRLRALTERAFRAAPATDY